MGQLIAVVCAAAGAGLRFSVEPLIHGGIPVVLFYPFVLIASVWGGTFAGITTLILAAGIADYFWLPPAGFSLTKASAVTLVAFSVACGFVIMMAGVFRALVDVHREAEARATLLAHEMKHRASNLFGVVQAIAAQTIRQSSSLDEFKSVFEARLMALARAQRLIAENPNQSTDLHALLQSVVEPFGADRFVIDGPKMAVPSYLGTSCALLLHELSTNAMKYGALSAPNGKVVINWQAGSKRVRLNWLEQGGPPVVEPNRLGFGSRLLKTAFPPEYGKAVIAYNPDGVHCSVTFDLI
jgi:two-component sensor histidine kinase